MGSFLTKPIKKDITDFNAAGCIFTNKIHILAGYQPNKKKPCISGFGGKRKGDETFIQTALRETLEELLNVNTIPIHLIETIQHAVPPERVLIQGSYIALIYSFDHLFEILKIAENYIYNTDIYPKGFPRDISTLILGRTIYDTCEISQICLLPVAKTLTIDNSFISDISKLAP